MTRPRSAPRLVLCEPDGSIHDHPRLEAVGVDGPAPGPLRLTDWCRLPEGSDLFMLPGRAPVGRDPASGRLVEVDEDGACAGAAFLAPAWARSHLPAYRTRDDAPPLPLYAYCAVGWADGSFWTPAVRVDPDPRQDPWTFDLDDVQHGVFDALEESPDNRILQQLSRCALEYHCRAAQNFYLGRHEAPLPTSVACNAQCVGCISLQPDGEFRASHERLTRQVQPEEIVAVAERHWRRVPDGVVSFGQGCEGEPLLESDVLVEAVRRLRVRTASGTVNLNTNASKPEAVAELAEAGLDSMRVSLNSARPDVYAAYYRPRHYGLSDVERSIVEMKSRGRFVSTNFLYFPGVSDTDAEMEAFGDLVARTGLDLVQVRNLNLDPELYVGALPPGTVGEGRGVKELMRRLAARRPGLAFGYFNPTKERYAALNASPRTRSRRPRSTTAAGRGRGRP